MWLMMAIVWVIVSTTMFTAQMEFFAKVSDPMIGGTYMTLLNTVGNLGNTWPKNLSLYLVDVLTVKTPMTQSDEAAEAGAEPEYMYEVVTDGFFPLNQLCIAAGVLWFVLMWRPVRELRNEPASAWAVTTAAAAPPTKRKSSKTSKHTDAIPTAT